MARLEFKGKAFVQNYHLQVKYHELIPVKEKSLTNKVSLHDNLIIHGDNLKALKALLPIYGGKVKCIYIDPPYNTGNEGWVYNDNMNSPMMQEWLGQVVDKEDLTRHDKWLCMMTPRLKLLREMLSDDGMLFASIDENEVHRFRALLDSIFGEDNCMAQVTVLVNPKGRVLQEGFAQTHEYILVYRNTAEVFDVSVEKTAEEIEEQYTEKGEEGACRTLELRNTHRQFGRHNRPNLFFKIYCNKDSGEVSLDKKKGFVPVEPIWDDGFEGCWTWGEVKVRKEGKRLCCRDVGGKIRVYRIAYAFENGEVVSKKPQTVWLDKGFHTEKGQKAADDIFEGRVFYAPKAVELIKNVIRISTEKDSLILDSFAGSGTTAQAVLELNREDGGRRRFILIQLPEQLDDSPLALRRGYKEIVDITRDRVERVIRGVPGAKSEMVAKGLGGSFSYFELGGAIEMEEILSGEAMPSYDELARYVFYTATGEEFDPGAIKKAKHFIGESREYKVYLFYEPDVEYLRKTALTLEAAKKLGPLGKKRRLVFAPTKYLDPEHLDELQIDFAQLPFEIYKMTEK